MEHILALIKALWLDSVEVSLREVELDSNRSDISKMSVLRHPNIISLFGYCKIDSASTYLVTQYYGEKNLSNIIYDKDNSISFHSQILISQSLCRGLLYLHSKNIVHKYLRVEIYRF